MTEPAWKRNGRNGPLDWWLGCQTHGDQWNEHCMSCGIALDHNIDFKARLEREKAAAGVAPAAPWPFTGCSGPLCVSDEDEHDSADGVKGDE